MYLCSMCFRYCRYMFHEVAFAVSEFFSSRCFGKILFTIFLTLEFPSDYSQLILFTIYLLMIDFRIFRNVESKKIQKYEVSTQNHNMVYGYEFGLLNILCFLFVSGAFLIPFSIMLILEGIPLFLIELGIGQKMRLGSLGVWNTIHPWLGGIGIASCVVTFFVALYYNVIITWCFYYLFNSFRVSPTRPIMIIRCPFSSKWQNRGQNIIMM